MIGGIAGLAPDIDIPITWAFNFLFGTSVDFHGEFTHSFLFVLVFLLAAISFRNSSNQKCEKIFYAISAGWLIHMGLDLLFGKFKSIFWPFATPTYIFPSWQIGQYGPHIDAVLLVLWLVHEEFHNNIREYY